MNLIKKTIPCKEIIDILTKELKEFGLPFAKDKKKGNVTKKAFDEFLNGIPKTSDNTKFKSAPNNMRECSLKYFGP